MAFLLEQAEGHVEGLSQAFHGEMACYAFSDHRHIARKIIEQCGEKQIAAAPPHLLEQFAMDTDYRTMSMLVEKGISGSGCAGRILHMLTYEGRNNWMAESLLEKRMWVLPYDYSALHACIENDAVEVAKLLLDGGMNFDGYMEWAQARQCSGHEETVQALSDYWEEINPAHELGGPALG